MANCKSVDEYNKALAHEVIHSTGHPMRLNRQFGNKNTKLGVYSLEELIAEMGSAMLCSVINVPFSIDNTVAYCANWSAFLRQEKKTAVIKAAAAAQKAVDYVINVANTTRQIATA
jgi:antirestriction protein ArdC